MSTIETLRQEECWRLVRIADGRCAVVEVRAGAVLSLHPRGRREAADTPEGVLRVVGEDGWCTLEQAEARFERMRNAEDRYAERLR